MKPRTLEKLGFPRGQIIRHTIQLIGPALKLGLPRAELEPRLKAIVADPQSHLDDPYFASTAQMLIEHNDPASNAPREQPIAWNQWGANLDAQALTQMRIACQLPVTVAAALMPDAHVGYGLPIGGVLATRDAVIPYAVGVDIACRMKLTVLDIPAHRLQGEQKRFIKAIENETRFGMGAEFKDKHREHDVMDDDWNVTAITRQMKDKAAAQLGTSGSGNHFVEFGEFTVADEPARELRLPGAGTYLALLSHSGSRGAGAQVCGYYSKLAMDLRSHALPKEFRQLAWLDLGSEAGQEYWAAMQLMGRYAAANHALIHRHIANNLGAGVLLDVENHHNFAWKETHGGEEVIVHRKGATPADKGTLGIIPGSMASPGFLVRGKGEPRSLNSASHGAGRAMSRTAARQKYRWSPILDHLKHRGVTLISAGLDEVPFAYKDIHEVMAQQQDLVETLARFDPKLVKMAPAGERPED